MNILHHKSWHVRNKDNIERVRKDEENARKEEEERQRKIALAESEARTELLRNKAAKIQGTKDTIQEHQQNEIVPSTSQHINFFQDIEDGKKEAKGNAEYEKEKLEEKEKQEKAIGLLTYLGQSAVEAQNEQPWYLKKRKHEEIDEEPQKPRDECNKKAKYRDDPMHLMTKYIDTKKKVEDKDYKPRPKFRSSKINIVSQRLERKEMDPTPKKKPKKDKKRKRKKEKAKKKRKRKHRNSDSDSDSSGEKRKKKKHKSSDSDSSSTSESLPSKQPSKSIQQLRAERIKREQQEKWKANQLLNKMSGKEIHKDSNKKEAEAVEYDDRKRTYNSLFNPDLVRKPRKRRTDYSDFS